MNSNGRKRTANSKPSPHPMSVYLIEQKSPPRFSSFSFTFKASSVFDCREKLQHGKQIATDLKPYEISTKSLNYSHFRKDSGKKKRNKISEKASPLVCHENLLVSQMFTFSNTIFNRFSSFPLINRSSENSLNAVQVETPRKMKYWRIASPKNMNTYIRQYRQHK